MKVLSLVGLFAVMGMLAGAISGGHGSAISTKDGKVDPGRP